MNEPDGTIRILAIDGAEERQDAYRRILENGARRQIILVPAQGGEQGLTLSRTFRPDCILLNISLPDMDAHQVLATLVEDDGSDAAVVMVSDAAGEAAALDSISRGALDYVLSDHLTVEQLTRALDNARLVHRLRLELAQAKAEGSGYAVYTHDDLLVDFLEDGGVV